MASTGGLSGCNYCAQPLYFNLCCRNRPGCHPGSSRRSKRSCPIDRYDCASINVVCGVAAGIETDDPPMGGIYVIIIKGTSIVSVIGISELVRAGEHATLRHPKELMIIYGMTALMYFAYCYPVLRLARWAEAKYGGVKLKA